MNDFDARRASLDLVTAFVNNNALSAGELPALLRDVFSAISDFDAEVSPAAHVAKPIPFPVEHPVEAAAPSGDQVAAPPFAEELRARKPAVSICESLADPTVICSLITGERFKTLKRHLTKHGLTEAEYKAQFNLPDDYPTVAPAYAEVRRKIALSQKAKRARAETDMPVPEVQQPAAKALKARTSSPSAKRASNAGASPERVRRRVRKHASAAEAAQADRIAAADEAHRRGTDLAATDAEPVPAATRSPVPSEEPPVNASHVKSRKKRRMARPAVAGDEIETALAAVPHLREQNAAQTASPSPTPQPAQVVPSPTKRRSASAGNTRSKSAQNVRKKLSVKFD